MSTLVENPFKSDISALHIHAPTTNLEFTDESENVLSVNNLPFGREIEIFVPQSVPPVTVGPLVSTLQFYFFSTCYF